MEFVIFSRYHNDDSRLSNDELNDEARTMKVARDLPSAFF